MGLFGSEKFELFKDKDFIFIQSKVKFLEIEIERFKTELISLRGLVNKKLAKEAGKTETETIKSIDGLDSLRN